MEANTLNGRWVFIGDGEYYNVGQITMSVGPDHYLVRMRPSNGAPPSSQLFRSDDLRSVKSEDYLVNVFDTDAELDAWLEWMNEPQSDGRPRVVSIRNPPKEK
jgi:hypothetical protein